MSSLPDKQTTAIATSTVEDVFIRGKSLCKELLGKLTLTEMLFFQMLGRTPTAQQTRIVDASLVALMEHGLTPSALATRLVYSSSPEAMQAAVAAGLLAVGSRFVGTMDECGRLLARIAAGAAGASPDEEARRIAAEHQAAGQPVPGFGHPLHKPDDPRAIRLLALAREEELAGAHVAAVEALGRAVDQAFGKHVPLNATGAIAAVLADCGVPHEILRGFAIIARCAGLVGHVHEEQHKPAMRTIWEAADRAVPYEGPGPASGPGPKRGGRR
jgi:citrate synthase